MFYEFAIDPELVATWHDRKEYLFFKEKFGLRTGRIVSAYPKRWVKQVWAAFDKSPARDNQNAARNLDVLLSDLSQNMVKRSNSFAEIAEWLDRAQAEHADRPFHAILSQDNPDHKDQIISATGLIARDHPHWEVAESPPVARTANDLVAAVAAPLRVCRNIVFIDPYFDPTKRRFTEPMAGFFKEIWKNRFAGTEVDVEVHTSIDRFFAPYERGDSRDKAEEQRACAGLVRNMETRLSEIIPLEKEVSVFIWKEREQGQKIHNRYILTEACGIAFGTGLDVGRGVGDTETDDLYMMDATKLATRWQEYKGSPPAFDLVVPNFKVTGRLRG